MSHKEKETVVTEKSRTTFAVLGTAVGLTALLCSMWFNLGAKLDDKASKDDVYRIAQQAHDEVQGLHDDLEINGFKVPPLRIRQQFKPAAPVASAD